MDTDVHRVVRGHRVCLCSVFLCSRVRLWFVRVCPTVRSYARVSPFMSRYPFMFTSLSVYVDINVGHGRAAHRAQPPRPPMVCPFMSRRPFMLTSLSVYVHINGGHGSSSRCARPPRLLRFPLFIFTCLPVVCPFMFTCLPVALLFLFTFREVCGV